MRKILMLVCIICVVFTMHCNKESDASAIKDTRGSGGSRARFAIEGNYLYIVDNQELKTYYIANAADPVLKSTVNIGFEIETIYPFKGKLFIGSTSVVHIFSIDDPEHPQKLGIALSPTVMRRCDPVVAKDSVAYATLRTTGPCGGVQSILAVYDIHDIAHPFQRASLPLSEPAGLGYQDSALYVCDRDRLYIYNIANPYNPARVNMAQDADDIFMDVIPYGNTLICWTNHGIILYDITIRLNPVRITKIT